MLAQEGRGSFNKSIESLITAADKIIIIGSSLTIELKKHIEYMIKQQGKDIKLLTIDDLKKMPSKDQISPP